ncbi:MAG: protein translocase subunit SecD, partial [Hyphomicrobiales bacterium]|nr:protein translocase subunit SecD [Hyphomicrobiales bacterium]
MLYFARWKIVLILAAVIAGALFTLPNFFAKETVERWPSFVPNSQLVLGLDLQGGAHILLQVERNSIIEPRVDTLRDDVRKVLREARIGYTGLAMDGTTVRVRVRDATQVDQAVEKLYELSQPLNISLLGGTTVRTINITNDADGLIQLTLSEEGIARAVSSAVDQSIEVVRRRIDQLGTTEPTIQRQGEDRILVQVPGLQDPQRLKDLLRQTAKLTFHLVCLDMSAEEALRTRPPADCEVLNSTDDPPQPYLIERRSLVGGEDLVDSQPSFDQRTNEPIVTFRFNTSGARRFAVVTEQNVGKPFAIVLDKEVISAPVIR